MSEGKRHKEYLYRAHVMGGSTTVDAGSARQVISDARERMSYTAMARHVNTSHTYLSAIARGKIKRISPERERRILTLARFWPTDTSHVSTIGSSRRVRALHALGWTWVAIAEASDGAVSLAVVKSAARSQFPVIEARHDAAIRAVYDRLSVALPAADTPHGRSSIGAARNNAKKRGWVTPMMWTDIDRDPTPDEAWQPRRFSSPELAAEWDHLRSFGATMEVAAARLGVSVDAIEKAVIRSRSEVA